MGANNFLIDKTSFQKGTKQNNFDSVVSHESATDRMVGRQNNGERIEITVQIKVHIPEYTHSSLALHTSSLKYRHQLVRPTLATINLLYIDTRYNNRICYNDNLTSMKPFPK